MSFNSVIKKNARTVLKGRWLVAILALAVAPLTWLAIAGLEQLALRFYRPELAGGYDYAQFMREFFAMSRLETTLALLACLLYLLMLPPLALGAARCFYLIAQGRAPAKRELLRFFESGQRYGKAIWFTLCLGVRATGLGVVFLGLPAGLISVCVRFLRIEQLTRQTRAAASIGILLAVVLLALMSILYAIYLGRYSLGAYLLCEGDDISAGQALKESAVCTKGYRGAMMLFGLSFAGWYLLVPLTLGGVLFFLLPYKAAAYTVLARYLVESRRSCLPQQTREFDAQVHAPD